MIRFDRKHRFFCEVLQHVRKQDTLRMLPFAGRVFVLSKQMEDDYDVHPGDEIAGYILTSFTCDSDKETEL